MGRTRMRRYAIVEQTVMQGIVEAHRNARTDKKATSKGNKAQGG